MVSQVQIRPNSVQWPINLRFYIGQGSLVIYELTPSKDRLSLWKNSELFCRLDILFPQVLWKNQYYCYFSFARLIDYSNINFSLIKGGRKKQGLPFTCGRYSFPYPNFWGVLDVDLCDQFIRPSSPLLSICWHILYILDSYNF